MAVTIEQVPTQLNTVYTKLFYAVTTDDFSLPQYKFVCDIEDYNGNLIQRIKQPANSTGHGIFNVAIPLRSQLQVDDTLYLQNPTASYGTGDNNLINSWKQFVVKFGEEYGTSPSSSVTIYDGLGNAGEPAVSQSNITLGRMTWEPWNEGFFLSSSEAPPYSNSGTGSFNYFVYEASGSDYVDVGLKVNSVVPTNGQGGTGSFEWTASVPGQITTGNGLYDLEVFTATGFPSADQRASLEVYDMSNQEMIIEITNVSASGGVNETLITASFTGSTGVVYGCRVNGIPTSSFNPPPYIAYYNTDNYTGSVSAVRSGNYPVFPGNVHNISTQVNTRAYEIVSNISPTLTDQQILEVYPTLEDFSLNEIPFIEPLDSGSYTSFNFNAQDVRINWTGSNPGYSGSIYENKTKTILTNWPQYQLEQLSGDANNGNVILKSPSRFRTVSENDLGIISWFNISGSLNGAEISPQYKVELVTFPTLAPPFYTGSTSDELSYTGPQLNALSPALVTSGSGADIPFCSGPLFPGNIPSLDTAVGWNFLRLTINNSSVNYWRREEPCDYETRSNFAFINKWGVWDFIGLNTPTNKSAVINERNEFQKVNVNYNGSNAIYSPYNRGFEQYYLNQNYKYKIATDYIGSVNSSYYGDFAIENFYQELFISPNVMLQVDDTFVPINITNSSFRYKTNKKGQKKYQVEIEYEFSNKPRSRT